MAHDVQTAYHKKVTRIVEMNDEDSSRSYWRALMRGRAPHTTVAAAEQPTSSGASGASGRNNNNNDTTCSAAPAAPGAPTHVTAQMAIDGYLHDLKASGMRPLAPKRKGGQTRQPPPPPPPSPPPPPKASPKASAPLHLRPTRLADPSPNISDVEAESIRGVLASLYVAQREMNRQSDFLQAQARPFMHCCDTRDAAKRLQTALIRARTTMVEQDLPKEPLPDGENAIKHYFVELTRKYYGLPIQPVPDRVE